MSSGTGRTTRLSRNRVLFESAQTLPEGVLVELVVPWPARLENRIGLKLKIVGRTLSSESGTAVRIARYEFRTCSLLSAKNRA